jgi:hypothetical protein
MTPKARKRLFRFLALPLLTLLIIIGIAVGILATQQQRLVRMGVDRLNQMLPGRLAVGSSTISLFQHFPYISIGLQNVKFYPDKTDTAKAIYEAERLFAGFSLSDIIRQKYHVKVISLKNGHLDLVQQPDGQLNIIEASKIAPDNAAVDSTQTPTTLDLDIKKIVLKNIDITYRDPKAGQKLFTHIDRIQSSFQDNDQSMTGALDGNFLLDYTQPGDTSLFRNKRITTAIRFSYAKATKLLTLPEVRLQLEKALFNLSGTADLLHDYTVDLKFSGDHPDFKQLFSFAPSKVAVQLKQFRYDGNLDFNGTIKGPIKKGVQPRIDLNFACANAWIHNTKANKKLDSLGFTGHYTNGDSQSLKTSELRVRDMYARPGEGRFKAKFIVRDFTDPKILLQVNSDLELGFIGSFLGIRDLERLTGRITLKMNFNELVDLSEPEKEMSALTKGIQSELTVRNLTFRVPDYPYTIDHLNLHANMKEGFVMLDSLVCDIGHSDFRVQGSLENLPALFHNQQKPVTLNLNAHSRLAVLHELFANDSMERNDQEEIRDFNLGLSLQTSVDELKHPKPLPKGLLKIHDLSASFKKYPHDFRGFGGDLTINDTALLLRNLAGQIDSSDIHFGGKVVNYALWFEKVKRGKTTIAFDLKSHALAIADVVGPDGQKYLPKDIFNEVGSNIWLRSKTELRYDSIFKFANIKIANITAAFQQHPYRLDSISGNIKFGTDNFIKIDTLKGRIGNSDFNLSMRLYTGKDSLKRKKENYLKFASNFLDADQLSGYVASVRQEQQSLADLGTQQVAPDSTRIILTDGPVAPNGPGASDGPGTPSVHAGAFNIFQIPFIDFNASIRIGRLRYNHLGIRNFSTAARMTSGQQLFLDSLSMNIANGAIKASGQFDGANPQKILLRTKINAEDVDIEKLMLKFDHLGQDYVINKNLRGSLSGQIETSMQVHPDLTPLMETTEARIDLEIINGVLINFAPMQAMASYFADRNLNMVRFDTLRNSLTFKNGTLFIPDMNINSSLGFMEIAGQQSMDTRMEYYLRIPLKLVTQVGFHMLFGKKKEEVDPDQVDAIEVRDMDKKVRFMNIKISGTPDNYKVALGKAKKSDSKATASTQP